MAATTLKEAPVHRDVSSAARAATTRLRPHLALADRFRLAAQPPVAPRLLRVGPKRPELAGVEGGRSHVQGAELKFGRARTAAGREERQTISVHASLPGLRTLLARSKQGPTGSVLDRRAAVPRVAEVKQFTEWSRSPVALPVQGRKLMAAVHARTPSSTRVRPVVRSARMADRTTAQDVAATLWHRPRNPSVLLEEALGRAAPGPGVLRRSMPSLEAGMTRLTRHGASAPLADPVMRPSPSSGDGVPDSSRTAAAPSAVRSTTPVRLGVPLSRARRSASLRPAAPGSVLPRWMPGLTPRPNHTRVVTPGAWPAALALAAPAAPRTFLEPPAAAATASAPSPPATAAAARPASPMAGSTAEGSLDATRAARWLARALGADAARPPAAGAGFDPRRTPAWMPSSYAKAT